MKFFLLLLLLSPIAHAECTTAAILNEDADYEGCRVNIDGSEADQKISESGCTAYCQLQQVQNKGDTLEEFKHFRKITVKPGEKPAIGRND